MSKDLTESNGITWRHLRHLLMIMVPLGVVVAFIWKGQNTQDEATRSIGEEVKVIGTKQSGHEDHASECFDRIDVTLRDQSKLMGETREALSSVKTSQTALSEGFKELKQETQQALNEGFKELKQEIQRANPR